MIKLIKYEFIKNRNVLLISFGLLTLIELFLVVGVLLENGNIVAGAIIAFVLGSLIMFFLSLIIGILTYTKELSGRDGFLIYMTPNSSYKIVGAKYLFVMILCSAFVAVYTGFVFIDVALLNSRGVDVSELIDMFSVVIQVFGAKLSEIVSGILSVLLEFLMFAAIYYLAFTLTSTILQTSKHRTFISVVLFIAGVVFVTRIVSSLPQITALAESGNEVLASVIPKSLGVIVTVLLSWGACGYMINKRINL